MRYRVLEPFRVRISQGEMELSPGQIITLSQEKALRLIENGKITPIGRVAYKIYSEFLEAYLWVIQDDLVFCTPEGKPLDEYVKALRDQGISEPIYPSEQIDRIKGKTREELKAIHKVKQIFPESKVIESEGGK